MRRIIRIFLLIVAALAVAYCSATQRGQDTTSTQKPAQTAQADSLAGSGFLVIDSLPIEVYYPSNGVRFYNDSILFLSPSKNERRMIADQISFGTVEAYYASARDSAARHGIFSKSSGFSYPAEALTFSPDFTTIYFTRILKGDGKEKIFTASYQRESESWKEEAVPLWFCHEGIRYSHPAMSPDGKMLVFASDLAGGSGKMDLYVTRIEAGKWSLPENLGVKINSAENEFYPYIGKDYMLYFSSEGLSGYGGYDIFICRFNGKNWDLPINLSDEVNSKNDDVAFTMNGSSEIMAVYSSIDKTPVKNAQLLKITMGEKKLADSIKTLSETLYAIGLADLNFRYDFKPVQITVAEKPEKAPAAAPAAVIKPEEKPAPAVAKPEPAPAVVAEKKDIITYRVQILSSVKPKGVFTVELNGVTYKTYEYYYLKEYRSTVGEFSTLRPAVNLQNSLRRSGRKEAFVVAFKNNVRSLDMSLFKL